MPVRVAKRAGKFRVIEATTGRLATNKSGTAVDGGGHSSRARATKQIQAINANTPRPSGVRKRRKNLRTVRGVS